MTHRSLTAATWIAGILSAILAATFTWAVTISVTAVVATAGPLLAVAGAAAIAYLARSELRATHVPDLDAANQRENNITAH